MSAGIWLYNEKICEGHECIKDCDQCSYADQICEMMDEDYPENEQEEKLRKWIWRMRFEQDHAW